jgi:hypothetical protein
MPAVDMHQSRHQPFQEQVTWMIHQFMIHETHGPMEPLLDWRTYRLKVHYNSTSPSHMT